MEQVSKLRISTSAPALWSSSSETQAARVADNDVLLIRLTTTTIQGPSFGDLDNAVLVNIFGRLDPLPNLFSLSRVCRVSCPPSLLAQTDRALEHSGKD